MTTISIPDPSLVVLVGISGSGKSTFAATHFGPYEVVSSDTCRGIVSNDPNDQSATAAAFDLLTDIVARRLQAGLLTVVDATSLHPRDRAALVQLARDNDTLPTAIVLDVPLPVAQERHAARTDRPFGPEVIERQHRSLRSGLKRIGREKFRGVTVLSSPEEIAAARIERRPLRSDQRHLHGPFDIIGDVHGCVSELRTLLSELGYQLTASGTDAVHPEGRTAVFVGDLVDRGPDSAGVLRLVMGMVAADHALCVPGNHEAKLVRALDGRNVTRSHGLAETMDQLEAEPAEFRAAVRDFADGLVAHLVLDDGRLVVAHAGLKEEYHNRASGRVRQFALYGDTTGELDEHGLPVRLDWAAEYRGAARVVYGHVPTVRLTWVNNTLCLDTGCVFGGALSALRYPELETVQVPAERQWCEPARPLTAPEASDREHDELRITDVLGIGGVETARMGRVAIPDERAAAALETMSRFALAPQLLPYLPPTMAPAPTSREPGYLEHPGTAFDYYAGRTEAVICEEKHMGSRAVVMLRRPGSREGSGTGPEAVGSYAYTRTGRAFFPADDGGRLLARMAAAAETAGLFAWLESDWVLLDGEMLPWNVKAAELIDSIYAPTAAAGLQATALTDAALQAAAARGIDVPAAHVPARQQAEITLFQQAFERYIGDAGQVRFAAFQVLATAGQTHHHRPHDWHLKMADALVAADDTVFSPTARRVLDPADAQAVAEATTWWEELTEAGGEGIVVKPLANAAAGGGRRDGGLEPGLKIRGREYLRMIYGPDYCSEERLEKLRSRSLKHKQLLALREYALGLEALERFTAGEPLHRVHAPVFGVLALESAPIDPRL